MQISEIDGLTARFFFSLKKIIIHAMQFCLAAFGLLISLCHDIEGRTF